MRRWALWLDRLKTDLSSGSQYDAEGWRHQCVRFTLDWAAARTSFPVRPAGDALSISERLLQKYFELH